MRLATIDIGTNTAQLLVAEQEGDSLRRVHTAERFVRLGEEVDASGRISEAALNRLLEALRDHIQTAREYEAEAISVAGTSALRDATNRKDVLTTVQTELGLSVEILSGAEEAAWSFAAACSAFDDLTGSCLIVDIGGGSTELVAGEDPAHHHPNYPEAITDRTSLNVGCVRLTERCFPSQPPALDAVDAAERSIDDALASNALDLHAAPTLVGTAGTATALALVHAGPHSTWEVLNGNGVSLSHDEVRRWRSRLLRLSVEDIRALHPEAMEGRADVFPVGVLLLDRIMAHYERTTCHVSPYELRHGLAVRALASPSLSSVPSPS